MFHICLSKKNFIFFAFLESRCCVGSLFECTLSGWQQNADRKLGQSLGRKKGMDKRGAHMPIETYV